MKDEQKHGDRLSMEETKVQFEDMSNQIYTNKFQKWREMKLPPSLNPNTAASKQVLEIFQFHIKDLLSNFHSDFSQWKLLGPHPYLPFFR